jgi:hypothetical protein
MWVPVKSSKPKPVKSSQDLDIGHGLKLGKHQSTKAFVNGTKTSGPDDSVQRKDANKREKASVQSDGNSIQLQRREPDMVQKGISTKLDLQNGGDEVSTVSSSASPKADSISSRTNSATTSSSARTCKTVSPLGFKSSIGMSIQRGNSSNSGSQEIRVGSMSSPHRTFSARDRMFAQRTSAHQYIPRYSGGNMFKSVVPGTWCPPGFTPTQKRRVQRLQALETREKIAEKKHEEWLNRNRSKVPLKMTWKEKRITTEKNRNADDMVADRISENTRYAPTDMDIDKYG